METLAAMTVILSFSGGICFWIGSKIFATRHDFHRVSERIAELAESHIEIKTDLKWIKKALGGNES